MRKQIGVLLVAAGSTIWIAAAQQPQRAAAPQIAIDPDDIAGVVTSSRGAEAGAWVIAETSDTPTRLRKIVVTDDQGRYLIPDLPVKASFNVWVRGYGLVDSAPVRSMPGRSLALTVRPAPDARTAARVYPASYWYSLIDIPAEKEFPGTGPSGNGIAPEMQTQHHWINQIKANCNVCHQMGNLATREIPKLLGTFASTMAAWDARVQAGQDGQSMTGMVTGLGRQRGLDMFARWTDRIAAGELPAAVPPRPQGRERNVVLTMWDWGARDLRTRRAHDRQAESHGQCLRSDLRCGLGQ